MIPRMSCKDTFLITYDNRVVLIKNGMFEYCYKHLSEIIHSTQGTSIGKME